jgi:feruloyl esterase
MIPGYGHGSLNGSSNPVANNPAPAPGQLYSVLTDSAEKSIAPDSVLLKSPSSTPARSQPICANPKKATYTSGDPNLAASYDCT